MVGWIDVLMYGCCMEPPRVDVLTDVLTDVWMGVCMGKWMYDGRMLG